MKHSIGIILLSVSSITPLQAATLVEVANAESGDSRVWINEHYARIDLIKPKDQTATGDEQPGEMIVDIKARKLYTVNHKDKVLLEMSDLSIPGQAQPKPKEVTVKFESQGGGPSIAGYATQQYLISADGMQCYKALFSRDVLKNKELVNFYQAMVGATPPQANYANACEAADAQMDKIPVDTYGIALRVMDLNGKTLYEVKKIETGVKPPANYLQLPAGYKIESMAQMLKQLQSQMPPPPPAR